MELPETGLVFHPDQYVHGVWLVPCNPEKALEDQYDWLCCLWRELDQPFWFVRYRFRYVSDPDPWAGRDRRNWSTFTRPSSEPVETVALGLHQMADLVAVRIGTPPHFILVGGDGDKAMGLLQHQSWMHIKEVEVDHTT